MLLLVGCERGVAVWHLGAAPLLLLLLLLPCSVRSAPEGPKLGRLEVLQLAWRGGEAPWPARDTNAAPPRPAPGCSTSP